MNNVTVDTSRSLAGLLSGDHAPTTSGLPVRVLTKTVEAADICSFELVAIGGRSLPPFTAGAHIDVTLPGRQTRQYSLCNNPSQNDRYLIAVLREPDGRGGSLAMHDRVRVGDVLLVSTTKNHFALADEAKKTLLLAGGIGITPILSMAEQQQAIGAEFEMHYCTRSKARTAFFKRIADAPFASKVQFHFDDGDAAQKFNIRQRLATPEPGTHLYVCGPSGFIETVLDAARGNDWPEPQLHCEFFKADLVSNTDNTSFEVKIASSGRVLVVPAEKSVVQVLEEAGVSVPVSCEQGVCGTCLTRVLEGVPAHRDLYLTPDEQAANDQFTPCCSRSKSPGLVLDL